MRNHKQVLAIKKKGKNEEKKTLEHLKSVYELVLEPPFYFKFIKCFWCPGILIVLTWSEIYPTIPDKINCISKAYSLEECCSKFCHILDNVYTL